MQNRIEPPVLLSRLMAFVLATAVVVLAALVITLVNMFPLNRPQIFFLTTQISDEVTVALREMPPQDEYLDMYKRTFIREYIRARNEVFANPKLTNEKWNGENGFVRTWSTDDVFGDFVNTAMWTAMMSEIPDFDFQCLVEFPDKPITYLASDDTYQVDFRYFCEDSTGRQPPKDYTIKLKLMPDDGTQIKWADRVDNPLGLRVSGYEIISGNGDPLDTGFLAE